MNDRETIIRVLKEIANDKHMLNHADYWALICAEAAELLKAQEPRVMTLEELSGIYVEFKDDFFLVSLICFDLQKIIGYMQDGSCRLWSSKPSFEQREAAKWDD